MLIPNTCKSRWYSHHQHHCWLLPLHVHTLHCQWSPSLLILILFHGHLQILKTVGQNCKRPLGLPGETLLLWNADQHQQSQPKMFPLQLENQASLLPPPQPTQKASVTKSIKCSIKCPNTFPNRALTWCIIRRKRKQQAPGCIMACVHIRIICATSQGVGIGAEHLNPLTISNKKSHFSLCSLHLQTETD